MFKETSKLLQERDSNKVESKRGRASVNVSSTMIAHGLGRTPKVVLFSVINTLPTVGVTQYANPDATNLYLIATTLTDCYWYVE